MSHVTPVDAESYRETFDIALKEQIAMTKEMEKQFLVKEINEEWVVELTRSFDSMDGASSGAMSKRDA